VRRAKDIAGGSHSSGARAGEAALVIATRSRSRSVPELRESAVGAVLALTFVATAFAVASTSWGSAQHVSLPACVAAILALALASRAGFEIGRGTGVPTQLVFVPMLFLLPTGLAPFLVMGAYVLERLFHRDWRTRLQRLHITVGSCWFALGPVLVLSIAGSGPPSWSRWPVYALALVAQIGIDLVTSAASEWLVFGQSAITTAGHVARAGLIDAALSPAGLALAIAGRGTVVYALIAGIPLIVLLERMAEDRETRIGQANELGEAYEGTALLLGDVVEADDEYTGSHTRGVVWLVERVVEQLGLSATDRRDSKLAAILHDVGKIRIPEAIINKPGRLTSEERAIIETHTIEGQKLLTRVGGLLAEIGVIVRSCHERVDGAGYPDGLAGEAIPMPARIVCVCDAFNAMITDRPYRARRTTDEALAELEACAGTHFDARVVAATVAVVRELERGEGSDEALRTGLPHAA
jgi:HD-GYP domain-containing protein (c-di-GMP phosphodiesterase class II)